jgi:hypothetical protein
MNEGRRPTNEGNRLQGWGKFPPENGRVKVAQNGLDNSQNYLLDAQSVNKNSSKSNLFLIHV